MDQPPVIGGYRLSSDLKLKGLFPHISEVEAEELWKRNELAV